MYFLVERGSLLQIMEDLWVTSASTRESRGCGDGSGGSLWKSTPPKDTRLCPVLCICKNEAAFSTLK